MEGNTDASRRRSAGEITCDIAGDVAGERLAAVEGSSLKQFVALAVAEKVAALRIATFFAEHRERVDWDEFERLMGRSGGEPPRAGDEVPDGFQPGDRLAKSQQ